MFVVLKARLSLFPAQMLLFAIYPGPVFLCTFVSSPRSAPCFVVGEAVRACQAYEASATRASIITCNLCAALLQPLNPDHSIVAPLLHLSAARHLDI